MSFTGANNTNEDYMKNFLVLFATLLTAKLAMATTSPLWTCDLNFVAQGGGVQILVGDYSIEGTGDLNCVGVAGEKSKLPIIVSMSAAPIDLNISIGSIQLMGNSTKITLYSLTPQDLLGDYSILQTNVSAGVGVGAFVGKKINVLDLTFPVSIKLLKGIGFNFGLSSMTLEVDRSRL